MFNYVSQINMQKMSFRIPIPVGVSSVKNETIQSDLVGLYLSSSFNANIFCFGTQDDNWQKKSTGHNKDFSGQVGNNEIIAQIN